MFIRVGLARGPQNGAIMQRWLGQLLPEPSCQGELERAWDSRSGCVQAESLLVTFLTLSPEA